MSRMPFDRLASKIPERSQASLPADCRELVATFKSGTKEATRIVHAPHWRKAQDHRADELSRRLGQLIRGAAGEGVVGRAFTAKHRMRADDPYSMALASGWAERKSGMDRVCRFRFADPQAAKRALPALKASGLVESCHPVAAQTTSRISPDEGFLALQPGAWAHRLIGADEALHLEPGSLDVVVAVVDSGVDLDHEEFAGKLMPGQDMVHQADAESGMVGDYLERDDDPHDDGGHGTHVAGVIGARGLRMNPGVGGKCRIMPVRVLGTIREGPELVGVGIIPDIDDGIKVAVDEGADVINLSLGVQGFGGGIPHARAVDYARLNNVVAVAASGNDGSAVPLYPGAVPGVITVGAVTELNRVASFSSWGPYIDVAAPGTAIYSTDLRGRYRYRSGTSHAAPFVAGVAALLVARARRAGLKVSEKTIRRILRDSADSPGKRRFDEKVGAGTLNALDAVVMMSSLIRDHRREDRGRRFSQRQPDLRAEIMS